MSTVDTIVFEVFGDPTVISADFALLYDNNITVDVTLPIIISLRLRNQKGLPVSNISPKEIADQLIIKHNGNKLVQPIVTSVLGEFKLLVTPTKLNVFDIQFGQFNFQETIAAFSPWEQIKEQQIQGLIVCSLQPSWARTKKQNIDIFSVKFNKESSLGYQYYGKEIVNIGNSNEFQVEYSKNEMICTFGQSSLKVEIFPDQDFYICAKVKKDRTAEIIFK